MSLRWFRRLIRIFPADFQADYARDMERTFRAQQQEARRGGRRGVAALWLETVRDILCTAPRQHMEQIAQDARYALRLVRSAPLFSAVAVATLAVGIGANTALFSIADAVLLRPLPFPEPDRLVRIHETRVRDGLYQNAASGPNFLDWQAQSRSFTGMAAYRLRSLNVSGRGEPRYVDGARASANFFQVLGVTPALGRTITVEEDRNGARVAVISDRFWRSQFNADPSILGQSADLDGEPFVIIGVLPPTFEYQLAADVWIRLGLYPGTTPGRGSHNLQVIARLESGRTLEQAQSELAAIAARLEKAHPATNIGWNVRLVRLLDSTVQDVRPLALVLAGAVGFVLLVACANIGGMLVARAASRTRELTVRIALGASRTRLVRQLLTESIMLATLGGALGVALAALLVRGARHFDGFDVPRLEHAGLDPIVLAVSAGLTLATGILFGIAPAIHVGRWEAGGRLRGSARGESANRERRRLQAGLNVAQVALAVMLLSGAGLMIRTLIRLADVNPGFDPDGVLAIDLSLSDARYPQDADAIRFYERVVRSVGDLPGVDNAALVSDPPLVGGDGHWENGFEVVGRPPKPPGDMDFAYLRWATPAYFDVIRVPLRRGRMLRDDDVLGRPLVVIVNEAFARKFFPGQDAVGQELVLSWRTPVARRIVGVVGNLRETALEEASEPQMYVPFSQAPSGYGTLLVSAAAPVDADAVRRAVQRVDPQQPIFNVRLLADDVTAYLAPRRITMRALVVFGALALGLALIGIYAVVSYQVRERTQEFGVRMALGAKAGDILRLVIRQGMGPAVGGLVVGMGGAAVATRAITAFLFETDPLDPATFAATSVLLLAAAFLACVVPARRATRVDPSTALRSE
jgi:putative ABC transport system permease protein